MVNADIINEYSKGEYLNELYDFGNPPSFAIFSATV